MPGSTSRARATSISTGWASMKRAKRVALAARRPDDSAIVASAQPPSRSPCAGGCHSSATHSPPAATTLSAKPARPTLTTVSESLNSGWSRAILQLRCAATSANARQHAASTLLPTMSAPAASSVSLCAARSCGSPSVPQTWPISASVRPLRARLRCASASAAARSRGGIRVRAEAQHDVEQRSRPWPGRRACVRTAALRSEGSIIGCGRPRV